MGRSWLLFNVDRVWICGAVILLLKGYQSKRGAIGFGKEGMCIRINLNRKNQVKILSRWIPICFDLRKGLGLLPVRSSSMDDASW